MRAKRHIAKSGKKAGKWVVSWLNTSPSTAEELQQWAKKMIRSEPVVASRDIVEAQELRRFITWACTTTGEQFAHHRRAIAILSRRRVKQIGSLPDLYVQVAKDYLAVLAEGYYLLRCLSCGRWFVGEDKEEACRDCSLKPTEHGTTTPTTTEDFIDL
jgi:hypothetical protein